jgi:redox-sensing transcriptional repressor
MAACGDLPRELCEQYLSSLLHGVRSDKLAMRRVARQNCAICQCMEERGLASCRQCAEGKAGCVFHEQFDRICPAGVSSETAQAWRLNGLAVDAQPDAPPAAARTRTQAPERSIPRLRWYLASLEQFQEAGIDVISSADIAAKVGVSASLVRRDLCYFGQFGTPSLGYRVDDLRQRLLALFRGDGQRRVAWIGAERLMADSRVLSDFARHDWQIIAAFDPDEARSGTPIGNLQVMHLSSAGQVVRNLKVNTVVLAVDESIAQDIAETLVDAGVDAVLNLTSVPLALPPHVAVQQADITTQLMLLSYYATMARGAEET